MIHDEIRELILAHLGHKPTPSQDEATMALAQFLTSGARRPCFVLRGYAGTGKTTLTGALVALMKSLERDVVLLAPTGRAAKVLSLHADTPAYTIHKAIYRQQTWNGEGTRFQLGYNKLRNALFIVDEASMLANSGGVASIFAQGMVLDDLLNYVYEGKGCRLLLVGDTAQLPPVGEEESPALSRTTLEGYGLQVTDATLTDVVRQSAESGVLSNATMLRHMLSDNTHVLPTLTGSKKGEVRFLPGGELIEALEDAYREHGTDQTIVITRSNKRANIYNNGIRARIFGAEEELARGDMVMAVKNNYYWTELAARQLPKGERMPFDFIANGDVAEVVRLSGVHELYGFRFANATLRFPDYDDFELDCRVLLSTLQSESPSLTAEESQKLYEEVLADYADIPQKKERMKRLREDPYYNAVQLKYAYAVTCHKAQGGQWARVFVDQGYVPDDALGAPYLRWLYTALTRTTERLYLVNWPEPQTNLIADEA